MDAMMTAKGDVWVRFPPHCPHPIARRSGAIASSPHRPQDPPRQVINDCTKEVDEVLRYDITFSLSLREERSLRVYVL